MARSDPDHITAEEADALRCAPRRPASQLSSEIESLLQQAERSMHGTHESLLAEARSFEFQPFAATSDDAAPRTAEMIPPVEYDLRIELGHTILTDRDMAGLRAGAIVPLEEKTDDHVAIRSTEGLIARGQVLVMQGKFCVRVTELVAEGKS